LIATSITESPGDASHLRLLPSNSMNVISTIAFTNRIFARLDDPLCPAGWR
jgi:hypothetical protein